MPALRYKRPFVGTTRPTAPAALRSLGRKGRPAVEGRPETVVGGLLRACVGSALEVSARVEGVVHTSGCDLLLTFLVVMSVNEGVLRAIETSV